MGYHKRLVVLFKNVCRVFRGRIRRFKEKWGKMRPETGETHLQKGQRRSQALGLMI